MKRPILVTGAQRSGSTWVGKMIAASDEVLYVHEPFNFVQRPYAPLTNWFSYVGSESDPEYQRKVRRYLSNLIEPSAMGLLSGLGRVRESWQLKQLLQNWAGRFSCRPLVKDPIAVMSAEWLAQTFNFHVVVVIRSPLAFAASCKSPGWRFDVREFLKQELLMGKYLYTFRDAMQESLNEPDNHLLQTCLCWNCIYHVVNQYREKYAPNWLFVRHEDLAVSPVAGFEAIYDQLNLAFTAKIRNHITGKSEGRLEGAVNRVSSDLVCAWRKKLTAEEIHFVRKMTDPVSRSFYSPEELEGYFDAR